MCTSAQIAEGMHARMRKYIVAKQIRVQVETQHLFIAPPQYLRDALTRAGWRRVSRRCCTGWTPSSSSVRQCLVAQVVRQVRERRGRTKCRRRVARTPRRLAAYYDSPGGACGGLLSSRSSSRLLPPWTGTCQVNTFTFWQACRHRGRHQAQDHLLYLSRYPTPLIDCKRYLTLLKIELDIFQGYLQKISTQIEDIC